MGLDGEREIGVALRSPSCIQDADVSPGTATGEGRGGEGRPFSSLKTKQNLTQLTESVLLSQLVSLLSLPYFFFLDPGPILQPGAKAAFEGTRDK